MITLDRLIDIQTSLSAHIHKDIFEKEKANSIKLVFFKGDNSVVIQQMLQE
jgi:hypothetical protein